MSLDKIQQLIGKFTKTVEDSHKLATPVLAVKLAKCLKLHPHDQTIGAVAQVIEKMASNDKLFICRAELKDLYKRLYVYNTKFAQLFQEELGQLEELKTPTYSNREEVKEISIYDGADQILSNALNSVFDKNVPLKLYSQELGNVVKNSVATTLDAWGLRPTSLEINDGNDRFLVLKANYETPKGITSFYIPVEVEKNRLKDASIFMGNAGPQDLNNVNVKNYITSNVGSKLTVSGSLILNVLTKAATEKREVTDTELALTKLNASRQGKTEFFSNQIIGQKVAEAAVKDVQINKSDEFVSFEKQFTSPAGQASFRFGADKVKIARENIIRELVSLGHTNSQVVVTDHNDNSIFYGVALDAGRVSFTVPVKIADGKINKPTMLICNGAMKLFDQDGINSLYINNESDYKVAASASPLFGLKPSDLINNIRVALDEGNHAKAEDALNVLANSNDEKAYATGFQMFLQGLGTKVAAVECKCNMVIKNGTSKHPICGHTGLPLHKVYQDKNGNCRPLYRRSMDETYEGASFMNAKIFG